MGETIPAAFSSPHGKRYPPRQVAFKRPTSLFLAPFCRFCYCGYLTGPPILLLLASCRTLRESKLEIGSYDLGELDQALFMYLDGQQDNQTSAQEHRRESYKLI
ncbi:hypothetical protein ZIOFF_068941 [Zingiber officinale]|uniref:Uncharacterized protein n=1 Tax=Zingiber officinale TaxID=94328 RepID=A0A8J5EUX2_ZINOF|nr:hypothetical protein ZIOFF_068941 [Zingiber officinale]